MKKLMMGLVLWCSLAAQAAGVSISSYPLDSKTGATPNLIFAMDDSGSMDWEILLTTSDGMLWWDTTNKRFWDATGKFNFGGTSSTYSSWPNYVYLFPNGTTTDAKHFTDTNGYYALPATPAYAFMRSADYNPLYYNPGITYAPWTPGYIGSSTVTFSNATPAVARSHPYFGSSTFDLTSDMTSNTSEWTFRMVSGMVIPGTLISGIRAKKKGTSTWQNITTSYTITSSDVYWDVVVPYYPATYWVKDTSCTGAWPSCATGPDGQKLRRYEIKSGNTFPSGRTYAAELQNFTNWFTYYRKRRLLLASGMSAVLPTVKNLRGGVVQFNNLSAVTMYDFSAATDSSNAKALLGKFYQNPGSGGTPMRQALKYVGEQYRTNTNVIQYGCQRNAAFVMTDGFADATTTTPPAYSATEWENVKPYKVIQAGTLHDIASSYFTINLRPDLPTGLLNVNPSDTSPNADKNTNLHMNTFGVILNNKGTIFGTGVPADTNPFLNYPTWPSVLDHDPTAVDDLWHATINGRGGMFSAGDAATLTSYLKKVISTLLIASGADSAVGVSNVNVRNGDNQAFIASYDAQNWTGELESYPIDTSTGAIITGTSRLWEARDQLDARTSQRILFTYTGSTGVPFEQANLPATMFNSLATPSASPSDAANVLAYIRGDRTHEGSLYRTREHLLGDLVYSDPTFHKSPDNSRVVYVGSNDGMLHAFSADTGAELWGYVPSFVVPNLNALTNPLYTHQFYVDGNFGIADVNATTVLVGGLREGGKGYFALDITHPQYGNESIAAGKVLWEFPQQLTATTVANNVGYSFSRPVIAKTAQEGWVVLVSSGYNNTAGDGKGHLFVLDALTGSVIKDIATSAGSPTTPSGLGGVSAFTTQAPVIDSAYAGDLQGNVWRFDLTGPASSWNVQLLATVQTAAGVIQPITAAPELSMVKGKRLIIVGTGKLFDTPDLADTSQQSVYGLVDDRSSNPQILPLRSQLQPQTVTASAGVRHITNTPVDYAAKKGWYFDQLDLGERVITDPAVGIGMLVFTTNEPSSQACSNQSFLYVTDISTGGELPASSFATGMTAWTGKSLGHASSARPIIVETSNGSFNAITHASDNQLQSTRLPGKVSNKLHRVQWKEIFR